MNHVSALVRISSFMGLIEPPVSGAELYERAQKLCDDANEGMTEAVNIIKSAMANEESPLNGFFDITGAEIYFLTGLAKYESTRGSSL